MKAAAWAVWVRLPLAAGRASRVLAVVLADGGWLARWPVVSLLAPLLAVLAGILVSQTRQVGQLTYTYTVVGPVAAEALGTLGTAFGLYLVLAYGVCDFFLFPQPIEPASFRAAQVLSYLLLLLLSAAMPLAARLLRLRTLPDPRRLGTFGRVVDVLLAAALTGALAFLWTQSAAVMIRPIYTWGGGGVPTSDAIQPLQQFGWLVAAAAAAAAGLRALLQPRTPSEADLQVARGLQGPPRRLPAPVGAVLDAGLVTLLMSGVLGSWLEALAVLAAAFAISLLRRGGPVLVPLWPRLLSPVPVVLRLALALGLGVLAGQAILSPSYAVFTLSLWPVAEAALVSLLLVALLTPDLGAPASGRRAAG